MAKPLVSVILCCYNEEKYINQAIDSTLFQTYENIELIIVDDNSTDRTMEICESYEDPRIRIYQKAKGQERGLAESRNLGVSKANGSYVVFQDADDVSYSDKVEKQVKAAEENPEMRVVGCYLKIKKGDKSNILSFPESNKDIRRALNRSFNRNSIAGQVLLYPKWVMEKYPYRKKFRFMQDYDQLYRLIENEENVELFNVQEVLYDYILLDKGVKNNSDWPIYNYFVRKCKTYRQNGIKEPENLEEFKKRLSSSFIENVKWKIFHFLLKIKIKYID